VVSRLGHRDELVGYFVNSHVVWRLSNRAIRRALMRPSQRRELFLYLVLETTDPLRIPFDPESPHSDLSSLEQMFARGVQGRKP
jgi:hypothetical protein